MSEPVTTKGELDLRSAGGSASVQAGGRATLLDIDSRVVIDGTGRVGDSDGDRSAGWEINGPSELGTGLLSKVLESGSGWLTTWDGGDKVRG